MKSGRSESLLYSLSRWTDVPAAKWAWFQAQLDQGWMIGIDPRTAVPARWSLAPQDVLGLVFWTKDPRNLIADAARLAQYPLVLHVTLTGWLEVERGAPDVETGVRLIRQAVAAFGPDRVVWRFSPIPQLPETELLRRFEQIACGVASTGLRRVYVSFLQDNDLMPETRDGSERRAILGQMGRLAEQLGMHVLLCQDDQTTPLNTGGVIRGVCESGATFGVGASTPKEECGCALAVDPFTINESCTLGCRYCYAADRRLASKKRNTTRLVLR